MNKVHEKGYRIWREEEIGVWIVGDWELYRAEPGSFVLPTYPLL